MSVRRVWLALPALAACGGRPEPYLWRDGAPASLELRVFENLAPTPISREVQVAFSGTAKGAGLDLVIVSVRHERVRADGATSVVATDETAASPAERDAEDASIARLAEGMLGRRVRLGFDPARGLLASSGMDAALDAGVPPGDDAAGESRDGLRSLLSDDAVARALRAAGMCPVPADFDDPSDSRARGADVAVAGHGVATVRMLGRAGREKDRSPVLRLSGTLGPDPSYFGRASEAPPPPIGPARPEAVSAEAETLYDLGTSMPLRGRVTCTVPLQGGVRIVTRWSFTASVHR